MFSQKLKEIITKAEKIGTFTPINEKDMLFLLEKSSNSKGLDHDEIVELLNGTLKKKNKKIIKEFAINYKRPRDRDILLLPPLYFSSICENKCLYCDFSTNKGIRLSHNEFKNEFNTLLDLGYRSIELVSSQDSELYIHKESYTLKNQSFNIENVLEYFEFSKKNLGKNGGGMLTSNIPPVDVDSFCKLKKAGLDCFLAWLESFNPEQYSKLHFEKAPKANQAFRLDSFERAIEAKIEHTAGAFLKGLYDWRKEEVVLYLLDKHLKEKHGRGFSIIGSPRLKGSFLKSKLFNSYTVSDEDYELNIALDRILFDGILWLQTRESFAWNLHLINQYGGGVILTLSSCTAPGGYSKPPKSTSQFPVFKQDLHKSVSELESNDFSVFFDWNSETLFEFQRKR
jgi:2-iminoacetate synthase